MVSAFDCLLGGTQLVEFDSILSGSWRSAELDLMVHVVGFEGGL
jgi:hypothetical protein